MLSKLGDRWDGRQWRILAPTAAFWRIPPVRVQLRHACFGSTVTQTFFEPATSPLSGKRAYKGRFGNDRSPRQARIPPVPDVPRQRLLSSRRPLKENGASINPASDGPQYCGGEVSATISTYSFGRLLVEALFVVGGESAERPEAMSDRDRSDGKVGLQKPRNSGFQPSPHGIDKIPCRP
jgi:hypothetical protein